jgi:hypothetical protein
MKTILAATLAAATLSIGVAHAQTAPAPAAADKQGNMQLSQADCTNLWQQAGAGNTGGLTEAQAKPYVQDFKTVNSDGNTTIDQNEWMAACGKGMIHSSSSSGASSGTSGSSSSSKTSPGSDTKSPSK